MTQLSIGILALQTESHFARAYNEGVRKTEYWKYTFEDNLDMIARLPTVAALVFHNTYHHGAAVPAYDRSLDWAANFTQMLGFKDKDFMDLMRLYMVRVVPIFFPFLLGGGEGLHVCGACRRRTTLSLDSLFFLRF